MLLSQIVMGYLDYYILSTEPLATLTFLSFATMMAGFRFYRKFYHLPKWTCSVLDAEDEYIYF